jgi:hypothetical protein
MQRQHVERERIPGLHRPLQEIKLLSPLAIALAAVNVRDRLERALRKPFRALGKEGRW